MDKELFRSFLDLFPGICHAFVIIREDGRSFLCDDTEILSRHRIRTDLCGDTGGDISNNGADGICDRGVLRNDRAGVEHARYRFQEEMDRSTDTDQDSIGEETGGEEIRLAFQSALEALLDQGVDLCVGHVAAEQVVFCIQQDALRSYSEKSPFMCMISVGVMPERRTCMECSE